MQRASETTFYSDAEVTITSARAVLRGTTYPLANISSVRAFSIRRSLSPLVIGILLVLIGLPILVASVAAGIGAIGAGAICIMVYLLNTDRHFVRIGTSGAETDALWSSDLAYVQKVIAALNDAIVQRG